MLHEVEQLLGGIHDASQYWANVNAEKLEVVWFMMRTCEMTHWVLSLTCSTQDFTGCRIPDSFRGERGCLFGMLCCGMYRGSIRKMHDSSFFPKETLPVLGIKETLLLWTSDRCPGLRRGGRLFQNSKHGSLVLQERHQKFMGNSWIQWHWWLSREKVEGTWIESKKWFLFLNTAFEVRGFLAIWASKLDQTSIFKEPGFFWLWISASKMITVK